VAPTVRADARGYRTGPQRMMQLRAVSSSS